MKVIFAKLPGGNLLKWIVGFTLLIILLSIVVYLWPLKSSISKEEVLRAVNNTQQAENFHWQIVSEIEFKGTRNKLSNVEGDKNKNDFHIKGDFLKTPLEIFYIGNMSYRKDSITKQWMVIRNDDIASEEALTTELNPLAALNFAAINDFATKGIGCEGEPKTFRIELVPQVASGYLTKYWQDFRYTLWVDKDKKYLQGYELTAKSIKDPTGIVNVKVTFSDFEEINSIQPPL